MKKYLYMRASDNEGILCFRIIKEDSDKYHTKYLGGSKYLYSNLNITYFNYTFYIPKDDKSILYII